MKDAAQLTRAFVEVADTLVDDFDLIDFLQTVTTHAASLANARAVGILLADDAGQLQPLAASDERAQMVELFAAQAVEGPCQDCFRTSRPVSHSDLALAHGSWPKFAPMALRAGYRSVHAFPLRLRNEAIGAITLLGDAPGRISDPDAALIQALGDIATIGLLQERAIRRRDVLARQLQGALDSRVVIEQAKGALAQMHHETPDQAFVRLRTYVRSRRLKLGDVARAVLETPETVPDLCVPVRE